MILHNFGKGSKRPTLSISQKIYILSLSNPEGFLKFWSRNTRDEVTRLSREKKRVRKSFAPTRVSPFFNIEIHICNKYQITTMWIIYDKLYEPLEMFRREVDEKVRKKKKRAIC